MKLGCDDASMLARRELEGRLTAREFASLDRHRGRCAVCGARGRAADPLALLERLREEPEPPDRWAGLWDGIRAGVHEEGRLGPGETLWLLRPAYRMAAAAAVVIGMGLAAVAALRFPGPARPDQPAPSLSADLPPAAGEAASFLPTVESIGSAEARVYDMKVFGADGQVTELVLIFDAGIDL